MIGSRPLRALSALALAASLGMGAAATADPIRVATFLPYVEDAIGRMPADRVVVVAAVRRSMHEPPRTGLADLGTPHSPSLESLAAARPNVVVGDRHMHASLAANVEPLGAELVLLDSSTVDATFEGLAQLAAKVGTDAEMQREIDASKRALASVALADPVATLALFGTSARWMVVTERSWLGDLLAKVGLDSVAKGAAGAERIPGYAEISDEQIATTRPALVLVVAHGDPRAIQTSLDQKIGPQGAWSGVAQSAKAGVHVLDPATFTVNPGLALPDAARALVAFAQERSEAALPAVGAGGQ